jgi:hypothetical protein
MVNNSKINICGVVKWPMANYGHVKKGGKEGERGNKKGGKKREREREEEERVELAVRL